MFFAASKVLWSIFEPINLLLIVGIGGLALGNTALAVPGRRLAVAVFLALIGVSVLPIADTAMWMLEQRFPAWRDDGQPVHGIVVLGGAINPGMYVKHAGSGLSEAAGRITEGAALAQRYPLARVVYAGGSAELSGEAQPEALVAGELLQRLGVAANRIILETRSRNTFENAFFAKQLAQPQPGERWLLVTSAFHMSRAVGCFRQVGFPVTAYPVDYRSPELGRWGDLGSGFAERRTMIVLALHEIAGLIAYRLTNKTTAWWPAP